MDFAGPSAAFQAPPPHASADARNTAPWAAGGGQELPEAADGAAPEVAPGPHAEPLGQRMTSADIQLVQNLVERCLQVRAARAEPPASVPRVASARGSSEALLPALSRCSCGRRPSPVGRRVPRPRRVSWWGSAPCVQPLFGRTLRPFLTRGPLQLYMARHEVLAILQQQARILPEFTALVWQKLEEQNAEFFAAYRLGLRLKDQIQCFNTLLEQHAALVGAAPPPLPGGPQLSAHAVSTAVAAAAAALHSGDHAQTYGYPSEPQTSSVPAPPQAPTQAPLLRIFSLSDLSVELTAQLGEGTEADGHAALMSSLHFSGGGGDLMPLMPGGGGDMRRFDSYSKLPHSFSLSDMGALFTPTHGEVAECALLEPPPGPPALVQGGC